MKILLDTCAFIWITTDAPVAKKPSPTISTTDFVNHQDFS
jgi:PIN domain nuclease of toxin-antitoxin system